MSSLGSRQNRHIVIIEDIYTLKCQKISEPHISNHYSFGIRIVFLCCVSLYVITSVDVCYTFLVAFLSLVS